MQGVLGADTACVHGRTLFLGTLTGVIASVALAVPVAFAANRYASPAGATSGTCTLTPCALDYAVQNAVAGDVVLLAAGTYAVGATVTSAAPIQIRPEFPATRPRLVGAGGLGAPTLELTGGGAVEGVQVESSGDSAIRLAGGSRGDRLVLLADGTNARAATLASDPARTVLVNSVAQTTLATGVIDVVDGATPGHVSMVNLTAVAKAAGAAGVTSDLSAQSPVLKNSIVRASTQPLYGLAGSRPIAVSYSNFATAGSSNWSDAGGNQPDVALTFTDEADGDYHLAASSPTTDAGAPDPLIAGTTDLDGRARVLGAAPDIGVYESEPAAGGTPAADDRAQDTQSGPVADDAGDDDATGLPVLPPAAPPVLAERVGVEATTGSAFVRLPGSGRFVPLSQAASIPVGSTIDATKGRVQLTSVRDSSGKTQTGEFWGGVFTVRQGRGKAPYTELVLTGGSFSGCPKRSPERLAARAAGSGKMRGVVRKLWGQDKAGRFKTRGKRAAAVVRGTVWLVEDRCDGTMTRVREGAVVVRDLRTGRKKLVTAGKHHLVRAPKRR